jgi:hypothetical protein
MSDGVPQTPADRIRQANALSGGAQSSTGQARATHAANVGQAIDLLSLGNLHNILRALKSPAGADDHHHLTHLVRR